MTFLSEILFFTKIHYKIVDFSQRRLQDYEKFKGKTHFGNLSDLRHLPWHYGAYQLWQRVRRVEKQSEGKHRVLSGARCRKNRTLDKLRKYMP